MPLDSSFSYSNTPAAILPRKKPSYRGGDEEDATFSLMSDPRVVRGATSRSNTAKTKKTPGGSSSRRTPGIPREQQEEEEQRSHRATYQYKVNEIVQPEIDLSQFLVEREEPGIKKPPKVAETQTDEFQERPDTPEYVPRKTGVDVETQVEDLTELFVFDLEVEPMLSVICAKTIEQAMFEVERESELINLQNECDRFEEARVAEQQWATAKEQETLAGNCTKDLALKGLQNNMEKQRQVRLKVAGLQAMSQMLPALVENISDELFESSEWKYPETNDIDTVYLPGLYTAAQNNLELYRNSQALIDEILLKAFEGVEQVVGMELPQQKGVIKLMATGALAGLDTSENVTLGFVAIDDSDTVHSVNRKVNAKISEEGLRLGRRVDLHGFLSTALGLSSQDQLSTSETLDTSKLPEILNIVLPDV